MRGSIHHIPTRRSYVNLTDTESTTAKVRNYFAQSGLYLSDNFNIRLRREIVAEFLEDRKFNRILDVACGSAEISIPHLTSTNRLTLVDISSGMLEAASTHVPEALTERVEYRSGDFLDLDFDNQQFDLVICTGLLAHISDPVAALLKLSNLLNTGGLLVLQNTNSRHFYSRINTVYRFFGTLLAKGRYMYNQIPENLVLSTLQDQNLSLQRRVCYIQSLMALERILSPAIKYRMTKGLFNLPSGRLSWLGNDCLYLFKKI